MKKCPYCAEEIQDEAILCRYCGSDLTIPVKTIPQEFSTLNSNLNEPSPWASLFFMIQLILILDLGIVLLSALWVSITGFSEIGAIVVNVIARIIVGIIAAKGATSYSPKGSDYFKYILFTVIPLVNWYAFYQAGKGIAYKLDVKKVALIEAGLVLFAAATIFRFWNIPEQDREIASQTTATHQTFRTIYPTQHNVIPPPPTETRILNCIEANNVTSEDIGKVICIYGILLEGSDVPVTYYRGNPMCGTPSYYKKHNNEDCLGYSEDHTFYSSYKFQDSSQQNNRESKKYLLNLGDHSNEERWKIYPHIMIGDCVWIKGRIEHFGLPNPGAFRVDVERNILSIDFIEEIGYCSDMGNSLFKAKSTPEPSVIPWMDLVETNAALETDDVPWWDR